MTPLIKLNALFVLSEVLLSRKGIVKNVFKYTVILKLTQKEADARTSHKKNIQDVLKSFALLFNQYHKSHNRPV